MFKIALESGVIKLTKLIRLAFQNSLMIA